MSYKVFLVEDEITTREGIRDNVDWQSAGFVLCGEAPDGEIALPQIEASLPDVLITDIKMPFMDGLQLCKIIREHMPWMKIIIISGYTDFQYAQTAIKLGVTEYLLKPVSVQDLQAVLARVAVDLNQEKSERAYLKRLRSQVEDNLFLLREKFLLRLVSGGESSISAIEQSQQLGLNILSPYYQVAILELRPPDGMQICDYHTCQQVERLIADIAGNNNDVLITKKDIAGFVLILKGESADQLEQEGTFLVNMLREEVESKTSCKLVTAAGLPQNRLGDLHQSFAQALVKVKSLPEEMDTGKLERLDHSQLRHFLETAQPADIEAYFEKSVRPYFDVAMRSRLLKHYLIVDLVLAAAQYVSDLGGNTSKIIPSVYEADDFLAKFHTMQQVRTEVARLFATVMAFRDSQVENARSVVIQQAKNYISEHFSDSGLSLNEVAAQVNFSPNHFSAVFSNETGVTFRNYLMQTRLEHAKKLLATTKMKCSEVAFQCGYNDPHYFSIIFRKNHGQTPQQFRASQRK